MTRPLFVDPRGAISQSMSTRIRKLQAPAAKRPLVVSLPIPSALYRRSIAALYAQAKIAAKFRRISRRLLRLS